MRLERELSTNIVGKFVFILSCALAANGCLSNDRQTKYLLSGLDKHGCAMFAPAEKIIHIPVVIWRTREGKFTSIFPGKNNCHKVNLPRKGPKPRLTKPD